ncbi:MAG TPA: hypothetical protein VH724_08200 [Candidatus Angelobacter sp.]|nr:hypothetical protein [Candidatus Angelobacter sp.]
MEKLSSHFMGHATSWSFTGYRTEICREYIIGLGPSIQHRSSNREAGRRFSFLTVLGFYPRFFQAFSYSECYSFGASSLNRLVRSKTTPSGPPKHPQKDAKSTYQTVNKGHFMRLPLFAFAQAKNPGSLKTWALGPRTCPWVTGKLATMGAS